MPPAHVEVHRPDSLSEALEIRAAHPDALPMAGGTDLMVDLNFDRARPPAVLDVTRIPELREVERDDFIYMAPYCPQGFTATGREPAEYLLYKDTWRDGF